MGKKFIVIKSKTALLSLIILVALLAVCICAYTSINQLLETISQNRLLPIYSVETSKKQVAITFDCAWGADDIEKIIKTLKKNNVQATFFVVGDWITKNSEAVSALHSAGFEIRESYFKSCSCCTNDL